MKKITLLFAVAMFALTASAATINNPIGADGRYIVKWDCEAGAFAASNDFEVDETFVFAVDMTGTAFEEWLKGTPDNAGATRSIAFNKWSSKDGFNGDCVRLKQIKGNIYGATYNLYQQLNGEKKPETIMTDSILYVYGQLFGFEYTEEAPGASWWVWPAGSEAEGPTPNTQVPGTDSFFATLPYTGTKTSAEFYSDDYTGFFEAHYQVPGIAAACIGIETTDIEDVVVESAVVAVEYYTILGVRLNEAPEMGMYIKTSTLANGKRVSEKVLNK